MEISADSSRGVAESHPTAKGRILPKLRSQCPALPVKQITQIFVLELLTIRAGVGRTSPLTTTVRTAHLWQANKDWYSRNRIL